MKNQLKRQILAISLVSLLSVMLIKVNFSKASSEVYYSGTASVVTFSGNDSGYWIFFKIVTSLDFAYGVLDCSPSNGILFKNTTNLNSSALIGTGSLAQDGGFTHYAGLGYIGCFAWYNLTYKVSWSQADYINDVSSGGDNGNNITVGGQYDFKAVSNTTLVQVTQTVTNTVTQTVTVTNTTYINNSVDLTDPITYFWRNVTEWIVNNMALFVTALGSLVTAGLYAIASYVKKKSQSLSKKVKKWWAT